MAPTMQQSSVSLPLVNGEGFRPGDAKAHNGVEDVRRQIGAALKRAADICGMNDKQVCAVLGKDKDHPLDKAQLSRWYSGEENVQLHRVYRTKLHGPFAIEQIRDVKPRAVNTTVTWTDEPDGDV